MPGQLEACDICVKQVRRLLHRSNVLSKNICAEEERLQITCSRFRMLSCQHNQRNDVGKQLTQVMRRSRATLNVVALGCLCLFALWQNMNILSRLIAKHSSGEQLAASFTGQAARMGSLRKIPQGKLLLEPQTI